MFDYVFVLVFDVLGYTVTHVLMCAQLNLATLVCCTLQVLAGSSQLVCG